MRTAACLQLGEEVPDMALHRLLRQEEAIADLAVHEPVGDELQDLDLAGGRILPAALGRRLEGNHFRDGGITARRHRLEASGVLAVPGQNLVALCSVHGRAIGVLLMPL